MLILWQFWLVKISMLSIILDKQNMPKSSISISSTILDWKISVLVLDVLRHYCHPEEKLNLCWILLLYKLTWFILSPALSSDRTNQMTKTHNDLDAILQLLQEASLNIQFLNQVQWTGLPSRTEIFYVQYPWVWFWVSLFVTCYAESHFTKENANQGKTILISDYINSFGSTRWIIWHFRLENNSLGFFNVFFRHLGNWKLILGFQNDENLLAVFQIICSYCEVLLYIFHLCKMSNIICTYLINMFFLSSLVHSMPFFYF